MGGEVKRLGPLQRLALGIETLLMTKLVPLDSPGPVFRWLFKMPILVYRLGLGPFIGQRILLLTTIGRKTGERRHTPLEYNYDPGTDTYQVMAGWGGHTDWYRNAPANPDVHVQVGTRAFEAVAEPVPREAVARLLQEITRLNPQSLQMWSRRPRQPLDGSEASWLEAARHFPCLRLRPVERS